MTVIEIDIPYKILWEEISYDLDFRTIRINRAYEIPKPKLFESPNKYIEMFKEYNNRRWAEEGFEAYTNLTGWKDANCRSYGMTILIYPHVLSASCRSECFNVTGRTERSDLN